MVAVATALSPALVSNAYAFKLFGINFFGKDDTDANQVPDPVRYEVTLTSDADDPDLKEALENSSRLVGDKG